MANGFTASYNRTYWNNNTPPAINEANLNNIENGISNHDNRIATLDKTKLDITTANTMLKDISFNESTGVITVTRLNGSIITIDTQLEKIAINFDYNPETQQIILTLIDGTKQYIDLSALITQFEFLDSDTVSFFVDKDGKVSANVKNGSITADKLEPNYLALITVQSENAEKSAQASKQSAQDANYNALISQSYAVGLSGMREGEDTDNAKYYKENAANSATTATDKASEAASSAANAAISEANANEHALMSESYFHGGTGIRENEDTENVMAIYEKIQSITDIDIATENKAGIVKASEDVNVTSDGTMNVPKLIELENLIKGATGAKVYNTLQDMTVALNEASLAEFNVGTNILIKAVGVPDFWISEIHTSKLTFVWVSDEDLINRVKLSNGTLQIGYYGISFLETDKIDLTGIATESYVDEKFTEATEHSDENLNTSKKYTDNKLSLAANNQQPTFAEATVRGNIVSGEKMSVILGKIRKWFSDLKTVAFSGNYNDLTNTPSIPSVGDGTVTITQNNIFQGSFSTNQSGDTIIELPNTWRPVQDNLSSQSTTDSLSANMGQYLANGWARDNTKLSLTGGTITGNITTNQNAIYQTDGNIYMTWAGANMYLSTYLENMQKSGGGKTINSSGQTIFSVVQAASSNMMYFNVDGGRFSDGPSRNGVSPEGWLWILVDGITTRKMAIYFGYGQTDPGMVFWYRCWYNGNWTTDWIYMR